jgi:hypothetical protein
MPNSCPKWPAEEKVEASSRPAGEEDKHNYIEIRFD